VGKLTLELGSLKIESFFMQEESVTLLLIREESVTLR
jgi:hypothetical protein